MIQNVKIYCSYCGSLSLKGYQDSSPFVDKKIVLTNILISIIC